MPIEKDDWPKPRTRGQRLSTAEIEKIKAGFIHRRTIRDVARELQCASRNVTKYYGYFRAEGVEQLERQ